MIKKYSSSNSPMPSFLGLSYSSGKKTGEMIKDYITQSVSSSSKYTRDSVLKTFVPNGAKDDIIDISQYYYLTNGLYSQYINYYSTLYPYYWAVFPKMDDSKEMKKSTLSGWYDAAAYLEALNPEVLFVTIARRVLIDGACYISLKEASTKTEKNIGIQFLPIKYCRSNKTINGRAVVDFNVQYFNKLSNVKRAEALKTFPKEITKDYNSWVNAGSSTTNDAQWQPLDSVSSFKFTLRPDDMPLIYSSILDILDVQDAKDITMYKMEQEISKIIVQKFGVDNQGKPIVDLPVMQKFQQELVDSLSEIPGINVATTWGDITVQDFQKTGSGSASANSMIGVIARDAYESSGVSSKIINADNAGSMSRNITFNEGTMRYLLLQFQDFLQARINNYSKASYLVEMPDVSRFNQKDKYDEYKTETLLSSQILAQVIAGRRQSSIISAYFFEKSFLGQPDTTESSTASPSNSNPDSKVGRPVLPDEQKTEKTLENNESL